MPCEALAHSKHVASADKAMQDIKSLRPSGFSLTDLDKELLCMTLLEYDVVLVDTVGRLCRSLFVFICTAESRLLGMWPVPLH